MPRSGGLPGRKGDIRDEIIFMEAKSTKASSFSLKKATLEKVQEEAAGYAQLAVMKIQLEDGGFECYVLPASSYLILEAAYVALQKSNAEGASDAEERNDSNGFC